MTTRRLLRGFTLLEILIALSLGALVIAGIIQLYASTKASYQTAEGVARIQENQRFAVFFLRQGIESAGLPKYLDLPPVVDDMTVTYDGIETQSDSLAIRYRGTVDCLGERSETPMEIHNRYYIDQGRLMCASNLHPDSVPEIIVDGIDHMQLLYGFDADRDGTADQYLNALALYNHDAPDVWEHLVSVRVALLLNSIVPTRTDSAMRHHRLLDGPVLTFSDRLNRQVVTATVLFRNRVD